MKYVTLLIVFSLCTTCADTNDHTFKIDGVTLAVTDMDSMLTFYRGVFGVEFKPQELSGGTLYSGQWGNMGLLLCPAEIAGNSAKQNRHQFEITVGNVNEFMVKVRASGGVAMGDVSIDEKGKRSVGIYDPDKNSILIKGD